MAWLAGWNYTQKITIGSTALGMSGNQTDFTIAVHVPSSNTNFWAGVKADGTDVRFTSSDGSTLLKFEIESFDNTGDDAWYHVKVPSLLYASDKDIYLYYGNSSATDGSDKVNAWDSNYVAVYHLNQDSSVGAFDDATSSNNDLTNFSTTDTAGAIDRARAFSGSSQYLTAADAASLSFGNGTTDSPFTVEATCKMTDATGFRIVTKGVSSAGDFEWGLSTSGVDKLFLVLYDNDTSNYIVGTSDGTFTADEGTNIHVGASYDGSSVDTSIVLYKNGSAIALSHPSVGTYVAMHNGTGTLNIGRWFSDALYANGVIDEVTISNIERSADWWKARNASRIGTWLTFGAEEHTVFPDPVTGSFSIPVPTVGTGWTVFPDPVTGTFSIPIPAVSGVIIVSPDPVTGSFSIPAPDIQKVIVLPTAVTGSFTIPAPSVILPTIVLVNAVTGTFAILAPDITEIVAVMMGVSNFPQSTTVEYKITDSDGVELQAWTSVGVNEVQGPSKSAYYVKTNVIGGGIESRGIIYWRTSDLAYEASDVFDTSQSNIATLLQRLTYNRAANLDNLDAAISTRPTVTEIWDEVLTKATHNVANSAGKRLRQLSASFVHDGTAQAGGTNTITLDTGASATDYIYNEGLIVIVGGTAQGETHHIMSYNGTTKVAVVDQTWSTQPDNTSDFVIFGSSAHDTIATGLAAGCGASTITLNGDASTLDNTYIGCYIAIPSGTGAGQARRVTGYNGTTKVATVTDAWATAPEDRKSVV